MRSRRQYKTSSTQTWVDRRQRRLSALVAESGEETTAWTTNHSPSTSCIARICTPSPIHSVIIEFPSTASPLMPICSRDRIAQNMKNPTIHNSSTTKLAALNESFNVLMSLPTPEKHSFLCVLPFHNAELVGIFNDQLIIGMGREFRIHKS
jgi:hypothetical protein